MDKIISIIGLGYVGLPLASEFGKKYPTIGYDININRVAELQQYHDHTLEVDKNDLQQVICSSYESMVHKNKGLYCTTDENKLRSSNFYIVTVPTPTDEHKRPLLEPLILASKTIASYLKKGDFVIYESTVYPGVTEEVCVPVLEEFSGLKLNIDFFAGYSPERINPGDKERTVTKIKKITSGSSAYAAKIIDDLYNEIIEAGTFSAESIKIAEAAKVIENSQRDINIAFVNELAKIFNLLEIDTQSVLEAAGTKWNFLPFKPGLVGGHCIGVDPYYLAQKAQEVGYHPEIILSGRRLNDSMGNYVAGEVVKRIIQKGNSVFDSDILMLGITFKENCPDIRNTRAIDVYNELLNYNLKVDVYDPMCDLNEVKKEFGINIIESISKKYSAIILVVAHSNFLSINLRKHLSEGGFIYDVKSVLAKGDFDYRL